MSAPQKSVLLAKAAITGNVSNQQMVDYYDGSTFVGAGIEAGGRIDLGTATTAVVTVTDSLGKVLYTGTVTVDTDVSPTPMGVKAPLFVTVTSISNSAHTLTVYWFLKR